VRPQLVKKSANTAVRQYFQKLYVALFFTI